MSITSSRYQQGTVERVKRAKGPDVWIFRWREVQGDQRVQRKKVIGTVAKYKTKSAAQQAVENFRAEVNAGQDRIGQVTVSKLWGHFQAEELRNPNADRSETTIDVYLHNMESIIIPHWGEVLIGNIEGFHVEKWLSKLKGKSGTDKSGKDYAPATKAKLRNQMSALFSHALRHGLLRGTNPIATVRQSAKRESIPDILNLAEMQALLSHISDRLVRTAILVAASTGLRRSEIRGLRWSDFDFSNLWLSLSRGIVGQHQTKLKTEASRKGIPISQDLADALIEWRRQALYRAEEDWVFASAQREGEVPVWFDILIPRHLHPAAKAAGINKEVGWHTFRHSLASLLAEKGEGIKVVQELLRHAKSSTTLELYQQANADSKRNAQGHVKSLFVVPRAS